MNLGSFFRDKFLLFILHIVCMSLLTIFLRLTGYSRTNIILILLIWIGILTIWFICTYVQRKKYFEEIEKILENVDNRYLLGELLPYSFHLEDRLYKNMIHRSNKSVIEKMKQMEDERRDYKEYIESWVHEIKSPLTSIALLAENGRRERKSSEGGERFLDIFLENQKIENYVDMVLYYARSEEVYKDFLIQKTELGQVVEEVLKKNRLFFIQNHMRAEVCCEEFVYTDKKWIAFILNQMVQNSVKYCKDSPVLSIYTEKKENGVFLIVEDNGVGILESEISRIFEKGFTGSNGRSHEKSTGIGLYLCKRLCDKLNIGLSAKSEVEKGTKMIIEFPISRYISREDEPHRI